MGGLVPLEELISGTFLYDHSRVEGSTDAFTFVPRDADGAERPEVVCALAVLLVNDRPVAIGARVELLEDMATALVLAASDTEAAELTFTVKTPPAHGTLAGTPPALTYVPEPNFNGADRFAFTVTDGELVSEPSGVTLQVAPVDDAPVWTGETPADGAVFAAVEGALLSVPVLSDVDELGESDGPARHRRRRHERRARPGLRRRRRRPDRRGRRRRHRPRHSTA